MPPPPPKSLLASPLLVAASAALLVVIPSKARNLLLYPRAFAHSHRALPSATPTLSLPKKKNPRTSPPKPQIRVPQPFASLAKGWVQPATDARTKWEAA